LFNFVPNLATGFGNYIPYLQLYDGTFKALGLTNRLANQFPEVNI
jgi:hypothetical protein